MWWAIAGLAILGGALSGTIASAVEQPKYQIVSAEKNIEIRDYAPMIVAEVDVTGERDVAIQKGFRLIADYIFGNNSAVDKVEMTSPVTQQSNIKIAMTAPVTQKVDGGGWRVRFVMPASYTLETLPKPNNVAVALKQVPGGRYAVIRFSGLAGKESLARHTEELNQFITAKKLKSTSTPTYAFYNPPWSLPFLRRNEVMVDLTEPEIRNN